MGAYRMKSKTTTTTLSSSSSLVGLHPVRPTSSQRRGPTRSLGRSWLWGHGVRWSFLLVGAGRPSTAVVVLVVAGRRSPPWGSGCRLLGAGHRLLVTGRGVLGAGRRLLVTGRGVLGAGRR